ncbi:hypothetical protein [Allorhizobium undicola]|uniref:hypothetical protein n=1 Tax=Allorhizobium undicola TaxID=78527 RepID=UPI0004827001|nr:hypothetical protein [Allorhizobium undicola]
MNMIIKGRRPLSSDRTRVFAADILAMARIQQTIRGFIEPVDFEPKQVAALARFAIEAGELAKAGVPTDWMLTAVAIGADADDTSGGIEYGGLYALDLEKRAMKEARSIWHSRIQRGQTPQNPEFSRAYSVVPFPKRAIDQAD